nr:hypothetical protein [Tanacetum cinerariifolium]
MARLQFCDYHNIVAILEKSEHNTDFHPIVDFIEASPLRIYYLGLRLLPHKQCNLHSSGIVFLQQWELSSLAVGDVSKHFIQKKLPLPVKKVPTAEEKQCHCCEDYTATKVKNEDFPLPEQLPTANAAKFPLLMNFALLLKSRNNYQSKTQSQGSTVIDSYVVPTNDKVIVSASEGTATKKGRTVALTTEDMQKRRNDVKARTTLLLALRELMLSKRSRKNTKCVNAANEELTAAKHKLMFEKIAEGSKKASIKRDLRFKDNGGVNCLSNKIIFEQLTLIDTIVLLNSFHFWATAKVKNVNGKAQIQATVDKKKVIITEASIRRDLRFKDERGVDCLSNEVIFKQLTLMGSTMASVIICLATNQKFNFSKYVFDNMVKHFDGGVKFLMYPRFVQVFLDNQVEGMDKHNAIFVISSHTKKVFANVKREGKDFSGKVTPLFETMIVQAPEDMGEDSKLPTDSH